MTIRIDCHLRDFRVFPVRAHRVRAADSRRPAARRGEYARLRVSSLFASKTHRMDPARKELPQAWKCDQASGFARRASLMSGGIRGTPLGRGARSPTPGSCPVPLRPDAPLLPRTETLGEAPFIVGSNLSINPSEAQGLLQRLLMMEPRIRLLREEDPGLRLRGVVVLEPPAPLRWAPESMPWHLLSARCTRERKPCLSGPSREFVERGGVPRTFAQLTLLDLQWRSA